MRRVAAWLSEALLWVLWAIGVVIWFVSYAVSPRFRDWVKTL